MYMSITLYISAKLKNKLIWPKVAYIPSYFYC